MEEEKVVKNKKSYGEWASSNLLLQDK